MYEKETIIDKIGKVITKLATALIMNLTFIACCIPIVTIGQAWSGLLSALRFQIRGESWWAGFKFGFKTRFLRGTVAWLLLGGLDIIMLIDVLQYTFGYVGGQNSIVYAIASCIMFALTAMLTMSFLVLNVYIPTDVNTWIRNAASVLFRAPLQLLGAAAAFWMPVFLCAYLPHYFYYFIMIFVVVYFALAGLATTVLLKNVLLNLLIAARADGTLLAEEGRGAMPDDEDDEEE